MKLPFRLQFMIFAGVFLLLMTSIYAQTLTPPPTNAPVTLKEYSEALQKERQLLQEQAKTQQASLESLTYRAMYIIGGIVGLGSFLLALFIGKTRKEVQESAQEYLKVETRPLKEELEAVKAALAQARGEIAQLSDYKKRRVVWIRRLGSVGSEEEDQKLKAATGLENVAGKLLPSDKPVKLNNSELVIFTYDGEDSIALLKNIVDAVGANRIPLLVYAPGPRLKDSETALLNAYGNYVPANSPLTLYERALALSRLG